MGSSRKLNYSIIDIVLKFIDLLFLYKIDMYNYFYNIYDMYVKFYSI